MEALGGVEPPTCGLGNRRSIHLSYRAMKTILTCAAIPAVFFAVDPPSAFLPSHPQNDCRYVDDSRACARQHNKLLNNLLSE